MIIHSTVTVPVESLTRLEDHPYFSEFSDKPGFVIFSLVKCSGTDNYIEYSNKFKTTIEIVRQMGIPAVFIPERLTYGQSMLII